MMTDAATNPELQRLELDAKRKANWKRWGPYLSERQWGTVREDYSPDGSCWEYFSHDQSRSRAYRWGEDGILGITDRECRLCFGLSMWNGKDPILKERLFGLTNGEGNHGEDCKELYYYLDSTPTHSYMKGLYKYPQAEFPYRWIIEENRRRGKHEPEFELLDTGVFKDSKYWDVFVEYAKNTPNDILIKITVANRGNESATIHLLPTLWFRNTWSWGCLHEGCWTKPWIRKASATRIEGEHQTLGKVRFDLDSNLALSHSDSGNGASRVAVIPELLFTDNESNTQKLWGQKSKNTYVKDAFHRYLIEGEREAVQPQGIGTKAAAHYTLDVPAHSDVVLRFRLGVDDEIHEGEPFSAEFDETFKARQDEADDFYATKTPTTLTAEESRVMRQAFAGLLWSKQFYHYVVDEWIKGDPLQTPPPESRKRGRNADWMHLHNRDIISMPDKWEYPWYAAWDLAFHMISMATVDPQFAKDQLLLFLREWFMHPSGKIPAYEFAFDDVNPPVHAWACWRVYKLTGPRGKRDRVFLARCFHKLLINFTWWINRKDVNGKNIFGGGFLGLDNIGLFDRSRPLPGGGYLEQADGTAWMAFYCATMLAMAIELASEDRAYEDVASKFFEHFVAIADAMNHLGGSGLWDEEDGFYYDHLTTHDMRTRLKTRSMVGLIPLFAVEVLEPEVLEKLPGFKKRTQWFLDNRKDLSKHIAYFQSSEYASGEDAASGGAATVVHRLLAIPSRQRLERVLKYLLDEKEFLSPYGFRSLSAIHRTPYTLNVAGQEYCLRYVPAESDTSLFGGNSNWRGPIWMPVNYLLIEALDRYHFFYEDTLKVECPTGSGKLMNLKEVATYVSARIAKIFLPDQNGHRPCHGPDTVYAADPNFKDLVLFHEYFDGDNGRGVGATHQTGWTVLITRLLVTAARERARTGLPKPGTLEPRVVAPQTVAARNLVRPKAAAKKP